MVPPVTGTGFGCPVPPPGVMAEVVQNGGSSLRVLPAAHGSPGASAWELVPPVRVTLVTFAVAYRRDGPISSTSSSMTVRRSPSLVSNDRCRSLPVTMTLEPLHQ